MGIRAAAREIVTVAFFVQGSIVVTGSEQLLDAVRRFKVAQRADVDQKPGCVFGLMTRDGVEDLADELERLRKSVENTNKILVGLLVSIALSAFGLMLSGVLGT